MNILELLKVNPYKGYSEKPKLHSFQTGGNINSPALVDKKPLSLRQMKKLSNNFENGPRGYTIGDSYYDQTGYPISQDQYNYYYEQSGKPITIESSNVLGELNNLSYISGGNSNTVTKGAFTTTHRMSDGSSRTLRHNVYNNQNTPNHNYTHSYDLNNPQLLSIKQ